LRPDTSGVVAIVVSFFGKDTIASTVSSLLGQVDRIAIIDNGSDSETVNLLSSLCRQSPRVDLILLGENKGIASALNVGLGHARLIGAKWILTMDQDSVADPDMVSRMLDFVRASGRTEIVATVPTLRIKGCKATAFATRKVESAITSGNMVRLDVFDSVGPYREDYFIDSVDFEFSLRLRKFGFQTFRVGDAYMTHTLGKSLPINFGFIKITSSIHPPVRRYYIFRNHCYLCCEYLFSFPYFMAKKSLFMLLLTLQIILIERKKLENLRMASLGLVHFLRGVKGKLL
jgi:rhamnosyltransferase